MQNKVQINKIVEKMVGSGLTRRIGKICIRPLVIFILSLRVIDVFSIIMVLEHKVLSQPHLICHAMVVGSFTEVIMRMGEISSLIIVSLVICN